MVESSLLLDNTLCKKMIVMSIDVNVLLVQAMKKQYLWLRKSCQILHWVEVEEHDVGQCSHIWRKASSV